MDKETLKKVNKKRHVTRESCSLSTKGIGDGATVSYFRVTHMDKFFFGFRREPKNLPTWITQNNLPLRRPLLFGGQ